VSGDRSIDGLFRFLFQTLRTYAPHDSDDGVPMVVAEVAESFPEQVLRRPIPTGKSLADDNDLNLFRTKMNQENL
jgi:hypothetical protein